MRAIDGRSGLLLALAVLGCGEAATAPRGTGAITPTALATGQEVRPVANGIRYRDAGWHPQTGRAGGASVTTRALLGRDGRTLLEVWTGPGTLRMVRVALDASAGEKGRTLVAPGLDAASTVMVLYGLQRDDRLDVQALLHGADGPRTGVVAVQELVKRRPDLAVVAIDAPATALAFAPVPIGGVIAERNGDIGATATCLLDVDGVPVDSAAGIWVDAGSMVTCAFLHAFPTAGPHALRVRLAGAEPADDDPANDTATTTITVTAEVAMRHDAVATSDSSRYRDSTHSFFRGGSGMTGPRYLLTEDRVYEVRELRQSARLDAVADRALGAFPEQPLQGVHLWMRTGGVTVHEVALDELAADSVVTGPGALTACARRAYGGPVVASLTLCSQREPPGGPSRTTLTYQWNAGEVTYLSAETSSGTCAFAPCTPEMRTGTWTYNHTSRTTTGTVVPFGSTFEVGASVTSGAVRFHAEPVIALLRSAWSSTGPASCWASQEVHGGQWGRIDYCRTVWAEQVVVRGEAHGW